MSRLALLFVSLLACGVVTAGCGDDDSVEEAVELCKEQEWGSAFSKESKERLEGLCEQAAEGDEEDYQQFEEALEDACRERAQALPQGSGNLRKRVRDLCEQAAKGDDEKFEEAMERAGRAICRKLAEERGWDRAPRKQRRRALSVCERRVMTRLSAG